MSSLNCLCYWKPPFNYMIELDKTLKATWNTAMPFIWFYRTPGTRKRGRKRIHFKIRFRNAAGLTEVYQEYLPKNARHRNMVGLVVKRFWNHFSQETQDEIRLHLPPR